MVSKVLRFLERIMATPLILHGHLKPAPPRKKLSNASPENSVVGHRRNVLVMPRFGDHLSVERYSTGSHIFGLFSRRQRFFRLVTPLKKTENRGWKILRMGTQRQRKRRCVFYCILDFLKWEKERERKKLKTRI